MIKARIMSCVVFGAFKAMEGRWAGRRGGQHSLLSASIEMKCEILVNKQRII